MAIVSEKVRLCPQCQRVLVPVEYREGNLLRCWFCSTEYKEDDWPKLPMGENDEGLWPTG